MAVEFDKDDVLAIVHALGELRATSRENSRLIAELIKKLKDQSANPRTVDHVFDLSMDLQANYNREFCDEFFRVEKIDHDWKFWKIASPTETIRLLAALPTDTSISQPEAGTPPTPETIIDMVARIKTELGLKPEVTIMAAIVEAETQLDITSDVGALKTRASNILALIS